MKKYVIDTNVVLDDNYINLDGKILIPQTVIEELNRLKDNIREHKGYLARKQIQKLYLYSSTYTDKIEFINDIKKNFSKRFDQHINDNVILNTIIELQSNDTDNEYILYTNDVQLILKQKMFNVKTYTNIKFIDVEKINNYQFKTVTVTNHDFEHIVSIIEPNRFEPTDIIIDIEEYNIDNNSIGSYFYITNEKQDVKYLFRKLDDGTQRFVSIEKLLHKYLSDHQYENHGLKIIKPRDDEQLQLLDSFFTDTLTISLQRSGTGKTLLQLFYQITEVIKNRLSKTLLPTYSKIVFIVNNSVIQSRKELGFLPGSKHEKILPFMSGIIDNLEFLFNGHISNDFDITKTDFNDWFEIRPVQYIRGSSINNQIVIVDEVQNLTWHELKTIVTRVNTSTSKLILLGDIHQVDETMQIDYLGIMKLIDVLFNSNINNWNYIPLNTSYRNVFANISQIIE